jgi:hypothetical protein
MSFAYIAELAPFSLFLERGDVLGCEQSTGKQRLGPGEVKVVNNVNQDERVTLFLLIFQSSFSASSLNVR